jgi:pyruvate formate lyase activating enzyme
MRYDHPPPGATLLKRVRDEKTCRSCGFCKTTIVCPSPTACIGCQACYRGCPNQAIRMVEDTSARQRITLYIDGTPTQVPERITIKKALELAGLAFSSYPGEGDIFAPCRVGGCYTCSVLVDQIPVRSCVAEARDGMDIRTSLPENFTPLRIIHGPEPHAVGGKATPWQLKSKRRYIEVAIWTAGCNLTCPQCQNYHITYDGRTPPVTPEEAAKMVSAARRLYGVDRMAISGGEPILNRAWLIRYFKALKRLNPDENARLHLDSNGTILTRDYIDELIEEASITDIGIEPKAATADAFTRITGITDGDLAEKYLETAWDAVKYVADNYLDRVFLGVGLPYNRALTSLEEVARFGERLASIDPTVQLCALDYFPTFRRREIERPSPEEMFEVKRVLEDLGLKTVVIQTSIGHFGPSDARNRRDAPRSGKG